MMLQRAQKCRIRLQAYCSNWRPEKKPKEDEDDYDLRQDILSPEEWGAVDEVINVLKPLLRFTKIAERRNTGLQDWVPIVDKLISHFYAASQRFKSQSEGSVALEWLHICCEKAWEKLNHYYQFADNCPAYYTAMVMDPGMKYEWFEQRWNEAPKSSWIPKAKSIVSNHWKQAQKSAKPPLQPASQSGDDSQSTDSSGEDLDDYKRISYSVTRQQANAFAQYCADDAIEGFKLSDWKSKGKKQPDLVRFALDHALPISVSECERSLSSAKFTLTPLRVRMKSDLFEALETLRAWFLQKHQDDKRKMEETGLEEELAVISAVLENAK